MAQGLDLKNWDGQKTPRADTKMRLSAILKRTRSTTGSRRIFPPQFKLQVLDSYRNDLDCRGNQRATARKYNIHRRQIQKWLQCEQNLRSSVEETCAGGGGGGGGLVIGKRDESKWRESSGLGKSVKKCEAAVKCGGGGDDEDELRGGGCKAESTLNRSAMIYARLSDAEEERSREENAVRATQNPTETEVYSSKLDAWNLKRVAQKLYPSSHGREGCGWGSRMADECGGGGGGGGAADDGGSVRSISASPVRDDNFNRVERVPSFAASDFAPHRSESREVLPKECCKTNDKPIEIFTRQTAEEESSESSESSVNGVPRRLNMGETCHNRSAAVEGQKLCDERPAHKCLAQKYTDDVDGPKLCGEKNELLCSSGANAAESNCLPGDAQAPVVVVDACEIPEVGTSARPPPPPRDVVDPRKAESRLRALRSSDEGKSFSPKRKWMQESMQEMEGGDGSAFASLPIKQRVKMNLKTAAAAGCPTPPMTTTTAATATTPKGVSPNFTIEKLCASDIKTENVTPPSYHSPAESDYYGWRHGDPCPYPPYPIVAAPTPIAPGSALPFPPPLLFSHRVIPDLVSLHFKPESAAKRPRSCSPSESLDVPLKEEKVSDGEDCGDIDVLSTTPVEKKTFDFAGYNFGKRRSFSVQFKLTVLDAFYNDKDCNKNQRATARKFNINRRQVQKWLSQESDLRSEGSIKNGKYLQRQRLGSEREAAAGEEEGCKQCPQHCSRKRKEAEEADKTIEVNVKHCTDKECLSRDKSSPDSSSTAFSEGFEFYTKGYYQSDLKSANVYDNYLFPDSSSMISHDSFFGWPNLNSSALPVPNFHFMASWYHNFDYCQEKSKIY